MGAALLLGSLLWTGIDVLIRSFPPTGEMHPAIGLFFVPALCSPIFVVATMIHLIWRRFFNYHQWLHWISAGLMYSLILLLVVGGWWMLVIPAVVNPVTVRWMQKKWGDME